MGIRGQVVWEFVTSTCLGPNCKQEQGDQGCSTPTLWGKKAKLLFSENQMVVLFSSVLFSPVWLIYGNSLCCSKIELSDHPILCCCVILSRLNMFTQHTGWNFTQLVISCDRGNPLLLRQMKEQSDGRIGWRSWPAGAQAFPCIQISREASWNDWIFSRSGVETEIESFRQAPWWSWCCRPMDHILRSTELTEIWILLSRIASYQRTRLGQRMKWEIA